MAAELVEAVGGLDEKATRAVVKAARRPHPGRSPAARVAVAVAEVQHGVALTGAAPRTVGQAIGLPSASASLTIKLDETSLRAISPQVSEMDRGEFAAMLAQVCAETGIWPQKP